MSCQCPSTNVPGPEGDAGSNGTNGTNGINAFTALVGGTIVIPIFGGTVSITVGDTRWMGVDQIIYIELFGYYRVDSITSDTVVVVENLGYTGNINGDGVSTFTDGVKVSPGGERGIDGTVPATVMLKTDNLAGLSSQAISRTNLGLGTAAVQNVAFFAQVANNLSDVTAATARTNLGLAIGTNVQAYSAFLAGLASAGPGVADRLAYLTAANTWALATLTSFARTLLATTSASNFFATIKGLPRYGVLGRLAGADFNVITDQAITIASTKYQVAAIIVENASLNMTTAQGGVYNAAGKPGGGVIVGAAQAYSALTASSKFVALTLAGVALTDVQTAGFLYLSLSTPQGAAATADVTVIGVDLS